MDSKELRDLVEAYAEVYAPEEVNESKHTAIAAPAPGGSGRNRMPRKYVDTTKPYNDTMRRQDQLAMSKGKPFNDRVKKDSPMQYKSNESVDFYDIVLSHLLDEGYADTIETAEAIMVNMSEEWRDSILDEAYVDYRKGKLPSGRTPQQALNFRRGQNQARSREPAVTARRYTDQEAKATLAARKFQERERKAGEVGREMDAHTSIAGKIGKALTPGLGGSSGASPRVAYGEPNTDRHQLARHARWQSSTKG